MGSGRLTPAKKTFANTHKITKTGPVWVGLLRLGMPPYQKRAIFAPFLRTACFAPAKGVFLVRVRAYQFDWNGRRYICEIQGKARRAGWCPGQGV
tara:strand:- start:9089 stop:9373 length:285 start_codon:yes stop_codon:yes gene_type:complete